MIHLYSARFKEASGDIMAARAALLQLKTESDENFIDNVIIKASMEKRLVMDQFKLALHMRTSVGLLLYFVFYHFLRETLQQLRAYTVKPLIGPY